MKVLSVAIEGENAPNMVDIIQPESTQLAAKMEEKCTCWHVLRHCRNIYKATSGPGDLLRPTGQPGDPLRSAGEPGDPLRSTAELGNPLRLTCRPRLTGSAAFPASMRPTGTAAAPGRLGCARPKHT